MATAAEPMSAGQASWLLRVAAVSHVGEVRRRNEDALSICGWRVGPAPAELRPAPGGRPFVVVADGMGGHPAGDEASRFALDLIEGRADRLDVAGAAGLLAEVNLGLFTYGQSRPEASGAGCTLAGVAVDGDRLCVFNVGDCSVFRVADGYLGLLSTEDRPPRMPGQPEGVRVTAVSQCLGATVDQPSTIRPHVHAVEVWPGDRFLVCSDGLTDVLAAAAIGRAMQREPLEAAGSLLAQTLAAGAPDNVSLAVVEVLGPDDPEEVR